jgi:hypothetical protein
MHARPVIASSAHALVGCAAAAVWLYAALWPKRSMEI